MTPAQLARIHGAAFATTRGWSEAEFAALLAQPGTILAHTAHAFALGRVTLDEAEVLSIACDPAHQRQGQARQALDQLLTLARTAKAATMFLEVAEDNAPARALYAQTGFTQTGRRPGYYRTHDGQSVAALLLTKALDTP